MTRFVRIEKGIVDKKVFDRFVPAHKDYVRKLKSEGREVRSGYWAERVVVE